MLRVALVDKLTGGTNDVNPAIISYHYDDLATVTAGHYVKIDLPIPKMQTHGVVPVFELLSIKWWHDHAPLYNAGTVNYQTISLVKDHTKGMAYDSANVIAQIDVRGISSYRTPYGITTQDYTDSDGHGVMVTDRTIYLMADYTTQSNTRDLYIQILYRIKFTAGKDYISAFGDQNF